jgi:hypothetical protein
MKKNIESNFVFIIGGIKEHKIANINGINKYGITHILRQIDDKIGYPPTLKLKEFCRRHKLDHIIDIDSCWTSREKKIINLELMKLNIDDSVQIEHANGGIKKLVSLLSEEDWTDNLESNLEKIQRIHTENSACCYKLKKAESNINHRTEFKSIQF